MINRLNQIERNIAITLAHNPEKIAQLERVQDISWHLTGGDGIQIEAELYAGGIIRYLITGTRSGMTVTAKEPEHEIIRKPRGAKPWMTKSDYNRHAGDILEYVREIQSRERNRTTGDRLDSWKVPKDVRDIIDQTPYRLIDEYFGDFATDAGLVDYVRSNWDIDPDKYTWRELTEWSY